MGHSPSLPVLLISALLLLSLTHGFGRKLTLTVEHEETSLHLEENIVVVSPEDYEDPRPNTNPRSGILPPSSPAP